jgi:hypothetical protein
MRKGVGLPRGSIFRQRKDCALSDKVHRGGVLVQLVEDRSNGLARVKLLRGPRILGAHVHDEMGIRSKKRHLTFRIATIGAAGIGFDQLTDGEAIRGFAPGRWRRVCSWGDLLVRFARERQGRSLEDGLCSRYCSTPNLPSSRSTPASRTSVKRARTPPNARQSDSTKYASHRVILRLLAEVVSVPPNRVFEDGAARA